MGGFPLAFADAQFAACKEVEAFYSGTVSPVLHRSLSQTVEHNTYLGLMLRTHGWLRTLGKLTEPADFQAALAASRALFEVAVDITLLLKAPSDAVRVAAWEEQAKLKSAEGLKKFLDAHPAAKPPGASEVLKLLQRAPAIEALRLQHWGTTKYVSRWTKRTLRDDAIAADAFLHSGFEEYYSARYPVACWCVHGSGLAGIRGVPSDAFPGIIAFAFADAASFSMLIGERALRLVGAWDDILEFRFKGLRESVEAARLRVWLERGAPSV
ncbi:MAG: hypothetical protein R3B89_30505 [Polyangiaceae bacterium]